MKCDELKDKWFNAYPEIMGIEGGKPTKCYGKAEVDEAFAELKEVYKDSVDVKVKIWERYKKAEDELRKTHRALWLARAWGANQRTKYLDFFLTGRAHAIRKYKWIKITSKCRAKAEQYK